MDLAPFPANRKDDFILSLVQGNWQIRSTFWDCDYSSHRKTFGTAITRPTEKHLGLRLLVPSRSIWDCDYSSHREAFGTAITRPNDKHLGLRLLVPSKNIWDCDHSPHRKETQQTIYDKSTKIIIFK